MRRRVTVVVVHSVDISPSVMFLIVGGFLVAAAVVLRLASRPAVESYAGKAVFVTGCDSGFGRMMALRFSEAGAHVFAACLTQSAAETLTAEAKGKSGRVTTVILNVTNEQQVQEAFAFVKAELEKEGKQLYALINNAGINSGWYVEMTDMSEYRKVMDVNYLGPVRVTKTFLPLIQRPGGRVVGVVSATGVYALRGVSAYAGAKFAHSAFMDALRNEMGYCGIKVVKVMPGGHKTEAIKRFDDDVGAGRRFTNASEDVKSRYNPKLAENFLATAAKYSTSLGDPINVVNAVERTLMLKNPDAAYYVGNDAWLLAKVLAILPISWSDAMQEATQ